VLVNPFEVMGGEPGGAVETVHYRLFNVPVRIGGRKKGAQVREGGRWEPELSKKRRGKREHPAYAGKGGGYFSTKEEKDGT